MRFGTCATVADLGAVKEQGWDFLEVSVQEVLQGEREEWEWPARVEEGEIAVAKNLIPAAMKVVGPAVDQPAVRGYMERVCQRAGVMGIGVLVFGSGAARKIPDGFDEAAAREQLMRFARTAADIAAREGVTIVVENLNATETNVLNTVADVATFVDVVGRANFLALADLYHMWRQGEGIEVIPRALPLIRHVHVADLEGRLGPGLSGKSDYRAFFRMLKAGGYAGTISAEAKFVPDLASTGWKVLEFLREQWETA